MRNSWAKDGIDWVEKIIHGDPVYTMCFLGMFPDSHGALNNYVKAVLKIKKCSKKKVLGAILFH